MQLSKLFIALCFCFAAGAYSYLRQDLSVPTVVPEAISGVEGSAEASDQAKLDYAPEVIALPTTINEEPVVIDNGLDDEMGDGNFVPPVTNPYQKLLDSKDFPPRDPYSSAKYLSQVFVPEVNDSETEYESLESDDSTISNPYKDLLEDFADRPPVDREESTLKYLEHVR